MRTRWPLLLAVLVIGGCDITNPPDWTADYLFPLNFPAIDLSDIPGGVIPLDTIAFPTPVETQDSLEFVGRILQSEDLVALRAEITLATTLDVTGSVDLSVAPTAAGLFNPSQSLMATLVVGPGSNTTSVPVNPSVFQNAETLFFQANVLVAATNGSITVSPGDEIRVAVNFIGTVRVSK